MLQRVAVSCSVLQCDAVCRSVLQGVAVTHTQLAGVPADQCAAKRNSDQPMSYKLVTN